jgi:hypothetical protein
MSYVPTGAYFFVKRPQYVEEATFGTTPTSPAFTSVGSMQDMTTNIDISNVHYRQLGSRDLYQIIKTGEVYGIVFKYQPFNTNFMKYGTEYWTASATGNIAKSISLVWSQNINGTENFFLASGVRTESIDIDVTETSVMVTHTLVAKNISTPATTYPGTGTPTYAATDVGSPWTGISGGSLPLTINSLNYDVTRFRVAVNQNLDKVKPNGETQLKFLEATNRDISVDMDMVVKDTVSLADTKTLTARTASYTMNSGTSSQISLTNLYLEKFTSADSPTANKIKMASFSGSAQSVTITN